MLVLRDPKEMQAWSTAVRFSGQSLGLVPTMGALHAGHISLARQAVTHCQQSVATIFVNPMQFGPAEDLAKYPRPLERDLQQLEQVGVSAVFVPTAESIYPAGFETVVQVPRLASRWEGAARPTHFQGVCTVVLKLFHLIPATDAWFGQKDLQQWAVLSKMTRDLSLDIRLHCHPIVREADGLAMSSRNVYLSTEQRGRALAISRGLYLAEAAFLAGEKSPSKLQALALNELQSSHPDAIDYVEVVDLESLEPLAAAKDLRAPAAIIVAARFGATRLLDNLILR